jgi:hypothetical protein
MTDDRSDQAASKAQEDTRSTAEHERDGHHEPLTDWLQGIGDEVQRRATTGRSG